MGLKRSRASLREQQIVSDKGLDTVREQPITAAREPLPNSSNLSFTCGSNEVIQGKVRLCHLSPGHPGLTHSDGEHMWTRAVDDEKINVLRNKDQFPSGAQRDKQDGKPQYGLISPGFTAALAAMLTEKAAHYGDRNWEKGIPTSRSFESLLRHVEAMKRGEWWDKESGAEHAVLATANLMFIFEFHGSEFDTMSELMGPSIRNSRKGELFE